MKNIKDLYLNLNTVLSVKKLTAEQERKLNKMLSYIERANFMSFEEASEAIWNIIK